MVVSDGGTPQKRTTATAVVSVERNLHAPVFAPGDTDVVILETQELGVAFASVTATDADSKVSPQSKLFL